MTTSDQQAPDPAAAHPPDPLAADPPSADDAPADAAGPAEGAGDVSTPQPTKSPHAAEHEPPVPPVPAGPRKSPPTRLLVGTLAAWVVLLLLAAAIPGIVLYRNAHDGSVDTVTSYLAALHRKDVTEALRIARPATKPDFARQPFLAKDVMRTDWRVVSAKEAADPFPDNNKEERLVSVRIAAADGVTADGSVYLFADPNPPEGLSDWRIPKPWADLLLDGPRALSYLSLNGKTFKGPLAATVYGVFPGTYVAQSLVPAMVTSPGRPLIVADAGYAKATVATFPLAAGLTPAAKQSYQQQMKTQLTLCARSGSRVPGPNCPFQLADPTTFSDGVVIGRFSGLHWKIDSLPTLREPIRAPDGSFTVDTDDHGQVTVTGEGVGISNGNLYTITVPCDLGPNYVVVPIPPNTLAITPAPGVARTC